MASAGTGSVICTPVALERSLNCERALTMYSTRVAEWRST